MTSQTEDDEAKGALITGFAQSALERVFRPESLRELIAIYTERLEAQRRVVARAYAVYESEDNRAADLEQALIGLERRLRTVAE